jgi:Tfp pilus assembly protein PilF
MASSYLVRNKINSAIFIAKRGLDRGGEDPRLANLLGIVAQKNHRLVEAKRWYDRALDHSPGFVPALVNRANLSMRRGEYEAAHLDLMQALMLDPTHVEAHVTRGILAKKSGQTVKAEIAFQKAIELDPENGFARYNLGVLKAESQKDQGEALRLFNEVLQVEQSEDYLKDLARANIESLQQNRLEFTEH